TSFTEGNTLWAGIENIFSKYFGDGGETATSLRNLGIALENYTTVIGNTLSLGATIFKTGLDTSVDLSNMFRSSVADAMGPTIGWIADKMRGMGWGSIVDDISRISSRYFGPDAPGLLDRAQDSLVFMKAR